MTGEAEFRRALLTMLATMEQAALDDYSFEVAPAALGPHLVLLKDIEVRAARLRGLLEDRYGRERPTTMYVDQQGQRYVFRADREHFVADPLGMHKALQVLTLGPVEKGMIYNAFRYVPARTEVKDHGVLNALMDRSRDAKNVIRDFRKWKYGKSHLVPIDEGARLRPQEKNDE